MWGSLGPTVSSSPTSDGSIWAVILRCCRADQIGRPLVLGEFRHDPFHYLYLCEPRDRSQRVNPGSLREDPVKQGIVYPMLSRLLLRSRKAAANVPFSCLLASRIHFLRGRARQSKRRRRTVLVPPPMLLPAIEHTLLSPHSWRHMERPEIRPMNLAELFHHALGSRRPPRSDE